MKARGDKSRQFGPSKLFHRWRTSARAECSHELIDSICRYVARPMDEIETEASRIKAFPDGRSRVSSSRYLFSRLPPFKCIAWMNRRTDESGGGKAEGWPEQLPGCSLFRILRITRSVERDGKIFANTCRRWVLPEFLQSTAVTDKNAHRVLRTYVCML